MSWWNAFLGWVGWPTGAQDGDNVRTGRITTERATDGQVDSLAIGLSATWACVNFWAGNIAALPLTVTRKGPNGVAGEARDHPLFWLLHDSPNFDQSAYDFWEFMCACLELHGNAYADIERRDSGFIIALTPIRPEIVNVSRLRSGALEYRWNVDGQEKVRDQRNVLHIRGFGGGPLGGLSPLGVCRRVFGSALAADRVANSIFSNGAKPSGILAVPGRLTGDQRTEVEQLLQEKFVGAMNAGRPMVLDNGATWSALTIDPNDAQLLESRQFSVEDICRVFEVDPHLVGHTSGNTQLGSSIGDQTLSLLKFKLRKRLKRIESALEKQLLSRAERAAGVGIRFNIEGFLRADSGGRATYYNIMQQFMTKNEIRALEGLPPVEGGDVIMAQMQDIPLADAIDGKERPNVRQIQQR
jgi:HK97 family phage portal protein